MASQLVLVSKTLENYAFGSFDLGGGANAFAEYADGAQVEVGPSERDIADGTTVGVSFTF